MFGIERLELLSEKSRLGDWYLQELVRNIGVSSVSFFHTDFLDGFLGLQGQSCH